MPHSQKYFAKLQTAGGSKHHGHFHLLQIGKSCGQRYLATVLFFEFFGATALHPFSEADGSKIMNLEIKKICKRIRTAVSQSNFDLLSCMLS